MTVRDLVEALPEDAWRRNNPFSEALARANAELLAASSDEERGQVMGNWLALHQPCLFGRIAAKAGRIEYCFLSDADLRGTDDLIMQKIQDHRLAWRRAGFAGEKSAFVVAAVSDRILRATPSDLLALAKRIGALYLLESDLAVDMVYHDQLFLGVPGREFEHALRWKAGVNVFASAADGRWWQDHRIPGGLAFSTNSVGHLIRTADVTKALAAFHDSLGVAADQHEVGKIESTTDAIQMAMTTIDNASDAISGKATWLLEEGAVEDCPPFTIKPLKKLVGKSHCEYAGYYHTDQTLPSAYFRNDVERGAGMPSYRLDFTYLFHNSLGNIDHITMGSGEQIRGGDEPDHHRRPSSNADMSPKAKRYWPDEVRVADVPELMDILRA